MLLSDFIDEYILQEVTITWLSVVHLFSENTVYFAQDVLPTKGYMAQHQLFEQVRPGVKTIAYLLTVL